LPKVFPEEMGAVDVDQKNKKKNLHAPVIVAELRKEKKLQVVHFTISTHKRNTRNPHRVFDK
jgi:hypothetical protein